jgi:hypothetical protein
MLGFVTAMETFCGQAFGARRFNLVGVVLQRGLAISGLYCCCALGMWYWCEAALVYMGQVGLCTFMLSLPVHGRLHVLCLRAKGLLLKLLGVGCTAAACWACGIGARQHWCTWDRCAAFSMCRSQDVI